MRNHYARPKPEVLSIVPKEVNSILSFGCGETEIALAKQGKRVVSIPVDPAIAAIAAGKGVTLLSGDLQSAIEQLRGQTFDCLLMIDVLHLVEDPVFALSSLFTLLRPASTIIALSPYIGGTQFLVGRLAWKENKDSYRNAGTNITTPAVMRRWMRRAGAIPESTVVLRSSTEKVPGIFSKALHSILSRQIMIRARRASN